MYWNSLPLLSSNCQIRRFKESLIGTFMKTETMDVIQLGLDSAQHVVNVLRIPHMVKGVMPQIT
jgi:hypothetical protein